MQTGYSQNPATEERGGTLRNYKISLNQFSTQVWNLVSQKTVEII